MIWVINLWPRSMDLQNQEWKPLWYYHTVHYLMRDSWHRVAYIVNRMFKIMPMKIRVIIIIILLSKSNKWMSPCMSPHRALCVLHTLACVTSFHAYQKYSSFQQNILFSSLSEISGSLFQGYIKNGLLWTVFFYFISSHLWNSQPVHFFAFLSALLLLHHSNHTNKRADSRKPLLSWRQKASPGALCPCHVKGCHGDLQGGGCWWMCGVKWRGRVNAEKVERTKAAWECTQRDRGYCAVTPSPPPRSVRS